MEINIINNSKSVFGVENNSSYSGSLLMWSQVMLSADNVIIFNRSHLFMIIVDDCKIIGCCYHLFNVISFSISQSDHIKRLPLYFKSFNFKSLMETEMKRLFLGNISQNNIACKCHKLGWHPTAKIKREKKKRKKERKKRKKENNVYCCLI